MAMPVLSASNPSLRIVLCEHVGNGVTFGANNVGAYPVPLARPVNDDLCLPGTGKCWQLAPIAYGFDYRSNTSPHQQYTIVFDSEIDGYVEIAVRYAKADTFAFGTYTGTAASNPTDDPAFYYATLNATTSQRLQGTATQPPFRENNAKGRFVWQWFQANQFGGGAITKFPVVRGSNSLVIQGYQTLSEGSIHEAVFIRLVGEHNYQSIPRSTLATPLTINIKDVQDKIIATSRTRASRVLVIGDSLLARTHNWGIALVQQLQSYYGVGGLTQRVGQGSGTLGCDINSVDSTAWAVTGTGYGTQTAASGGATASSLYVPGETGYKWTTGQTGSLAYSFTAPNWEIIYSKTATGGSFTWSIDGGSTTTISTTGTAGTYGKVSGTVTNAAHTLTIGKAGSGDVMINSVGFVQSSGVMGGRIALSGSNWSNMLPSSLRASWASYLAAFAPDVIILGTVNSKPNGTGWANHDLNDFCKPFADMLDVLADTSSAKVLICEMHRFISGTYTTPVAYFTYDSDPTPEYTAEITDIIQRRQFARDVSFASFDRYMGYSKADQRQWYAGVWNTTADDGTNRTVTDSHTSNNGGDLLGRVLGKQITGEIAEDSIAALLARVPGTVMPQSGDAYEAANDALASADEAARPGDAMALTADARLNNLDVAVSTRLAAADYTDPPAASTGDGDYPIDHDGGTGAGDAAATVDGVDSAADIMRYTASGVGIDNVTIRAYLKSGYDAGTRAIVGSTYTGSDGRWIAPISLDSGTYYIIAGKSGSFPNHTSTVVVP